jgi:hypothetical protein
MGSLSPEEVGELVELRADRFADLGENHGVAPYVLMVAGRLYRRSRRPTRRVNALR